MNKIAGDLRLHQCVHHLFERQAERTPHEPAVVFEDDRLSFLELNVRANRLAHELRGHGVGPEVPVALFVERSVEMAVALLGVLKAGGAYVPLDSEQPVERQSIILKDCRVPVIVTQKHLLSRLPVHESKVVYVESAKPLSNIGPENENPAVDIRSDQMAYIIYTSGTTGGPKGVVVEHRQLMNYLHAAAERHSLLVGGRYALVQPLSFDACITTIFSPWIQGGCLHILSRERSLDPERLLDYFKRHPIDYLKITPSHLSMFFTASRPEALAPRVGLLVGGEAATWDLLDRVHALNPQCAIFNEYGPTEATVGASVWRYSRPVEERLSPAPPIGCPLGQSRLYILDEGLDPVPEGSIGELYIGGHQLARGYVNRPDMTAEHFLPDPFVSDPGARLYRTGDRVQRLADGNLAFIGRRDRQVKIRGFRIEPGEVEGVLSEHAAVRHAVVEPYTEPDGRMRLAAYVVPEKGETPVPIHLLHFLRQRLPDPMVPSSVIFLEAIPHTPHGKVDRKSLPHPEKTRTGLDQTLVRPENPAERAILELWQDVLGVAPIGINEDFFDLGGDSLLASTLVMRLRRELHYAVSVRTIFECPTIERLAKHLEREGHPSDGEPLPTIPLVSRDRVIPLSFAQERIWFIQQSHPTEVAYNFGAKMGFEGDLHVDALKRSLTEEVRRHEIYRTTILLHEERPIQKVHPPWSVELPVTDLSMLPERLRQAETERHIDALLRQPFDLTRLPLVRWKLLRLDHKHHVLIHVEHHIVHDGWATDVFFQELFELYNAFSRGKPSPLAEVPIQYADFTCWQREWMQGPAAAKQREFWMRTLNGCQPYLSLPTTRPRPAEQTYRGNRQITELDENTWETLCALGRREKATPFMVMLAALYALLYHHTGQTDMNVGTGVGNRRLPEVHGMLGMLINNLVLRADLSGNPSFRALLQRVRDVTMAAYDNDDLPFHHVVGMVGGPRDPSRNPLFQVFFSFHDTPMPDVSVPDMTVTMDQPLNTRTAKFDLNIVVFPGAIRGVPVNIPATRGATWMMWEYNSDLFDMDIISRLVRHYHNVLNKAITNPDHTLSMFSPLDIRERQQLLLEWNNTTADYPHEHHLHELFEQQVCRTPDRIAVVFETESLTYHELNARANQLAHYLQEQGVGPEKRVGLCMDRSLDMVVGLYGILKSGGTYVPLDPNYPLERLAFMAEDADLCLIVTQRKFQEHLSFLGVPLIYFDADWPDIIPGSETNPVRGSAADSLAYIIYTSGSTGSPKGTLTGHRALCNQMHWMQTNWPLSHDDRVLHKTPFSFDVSLWEFFWPLLAGAKLIIARPDGHGDTGYLSEVIVEQGITTLHFVPSMLSIFLEEPKLKECCSLQRALCAGEALPVELQTRFFQRLDAELLNVYGPTETCIGVTGWTCTRDDHQSFVPLGIPAANTQIYVLDRYAHVVPIGVIGEVYIGGEGLAHGYLNRPGETAEKFLPDPYSGKAGARLYRTGDLARYHPDSRLEFIGRIDHQVKLRGFRIELGEIESVLNEHPDVTQSVVIVKEHGSSDKRLVAFCVSANDTKLKSSELRSRLQQKLPDYLVPAEFIILEALPHTRNGKIDRDALLHCETEEQRSHEDFVAPRNMIEAHLAGIWNEVLKRKPIGVHDNFFEVGGHSLLAMQVVNRIRSNFDIDLNFIQLFKTSTISSLAEVISVRRTTQGVGNVNLTI